MSKKPEGLEEIEWEKAQRLSLLVADNGKVTEHPGFYAFTEIPGALQINKVLYIGETGQKGGIRSRCRYNYLIRNPKRYKGKHKGCLFMLDARIKKGDQSLWMQWAPAEFDKETRQELEMAMMQYYNTAYNTRGMKKDIPYETT